MKIQSFAELNHRIMQKSIEFVNHCEALSQELDVIIKTKRDELLSGRHAAEDYDELSSALDELGKIKYPKTSFSKNEDKIIICIHKFGGYWDIVLRSNGTWELK